MRVNLEVSLEKIEEQSLRQMEALLHHSTRGVHALFDNQSIANILKNPTDHKVFTDVEKIKLVQGILTQLISKKSYNDKMSFLRDLDSESYEMLIRTYFHIVENTIRSNSSLQH
jgi:hypothetical protein